MARPRTVTSTVTSLCLGFCIFGTACEGLLGSVDVVPAQPSALTPGPVEPEPGPSASPGEEALPPVSGAMAPEAPAGDLPLGEERPRPVPSSPPTENVSGEPREAEQPSPPPPERPIVADGAPAELERIGVDGGEPHRGICEGGIIIGIRPTANPSDDVFGQRLTFIEPVCGKPTLDTVGALDGPAGARVTVVPDDSLLVWDETGDFQGGPSAEVPDPRLVWIPQPVTVCPETTPVLVGLSGEYDPAAPDSTVTAAIRSLFIECAPLVVADNGIDVAAAESGHQIVARADSFAADGSQAYASSCSDGSVTTQIQVHAGFWLDGFVLGCSSLRIPQLAGAACSEGDECVSGVCSPASVCSP